MVRWIENCLPYQGTQNCWWRWRCFRRRDHILDERLQKLTAGYSSENIWNMDESGCFFKALPDKGLLGKGKQAKGSKKLKQRFTIAFFVNTAGVKVEESVVIWKSWMPRCFRELRDRSRPANVHYFLNPKSWMTPEFMLAVLKRFNRKLLFEQRKVILFLLFKSSRSSTGKGWLSMWSEESWKTLLQRKSLRM